MDHNFGQGGGAQDKSVELRSPQTGDEAGATLLLALVFLIVIGLMVTALVSWAGNDLVNTVNFVKAKSLQNTAGGAVQLEMQIMRYKFPTTTGLLVSCTPGGGSSFQLSPTTQAVAVFCITTYTAFDVKTRVVEFYACPSSLSMAACQASPFLQAEVVFNDFPKNGNADSCSASLTATCGAGMTVTKWVMH